MLDAITQMMQAQPPQQMAAQAMPTVMNPGGGMQPPADPLEQGFSAVILVIDRFIQDARMHGGRDAERLEQIARAMSAKVLREKGRRRQEMERAFESAQHMSMNAQMPQMGAF